MVREQVHADGSTIDIVGSRRTAKVSVSVSKLVPS